MTRLKITDITRYVEENVGAFHQKRIEALNNLKLKTVLFLLTAEKRMLFFRTFVRFF
ncbi:MAG: hypothetical protein LBF67_07650 [Prevotellaceae bacterium]|nr:hypothetical protein [Prevotellaceae bacterium]